MAYLLSDATISKCETYRYLLRRIWSDATPLGVVMLNPSTADMTTDDNTIRRCVNFAKSFGHGGILVANLFAYRATKPEELFTAADPVGPDNLAQVEAMLQQVESVLCAWGTQGDFLGQGKKMTEFIAKRKPMYCLGVNKNGSPKHPLYIASSTKLIPYELHNRY